MRNDKRTLSPSPRKLEYYNLRYSNAATAATYSLPRHYTSPATTKRTTSTRTKRAASITTPTAATTTIRRRTPTPTSRGASRSRVNKNNLTDGVNNVLDSITYERNWSQVISGSTSGLLLVMIIALFYAIYILCRPYADSISFGLLLSVILHPKTRNHCFDSYTAREECRRQMRLMQQAWAQRSSLFGIVGSLLSLKLFFSYALFQVVIFFGLNKLSVGSWWLVKGRKGMEKISRKGERFFLVSTRRGRILLRLIAGCVLSLLAHCLVGFSFFLLMHLVLFVIFAVTVLFVSENYFIELMWRLWRISIVTFFVIGLSYNLALDVISISGAVKRTTSAVVNARQQWTSKEFLKENTTSTTTAINNNDNNNKNATTTTTNTINGTSTTSFKNISIKGMVNISANTTTSSSYLSDVQEMILSEVQHRVLAEIAECMNYTNVTELAINVRHIISPILSTFPPNITMSEMLNKGRELYTSFFNSNISSSGTSLRNVDWVGVAKSLLERWRPFFVYTTHVLFLLSSNVVGFFDSIYAFVFFIFVLQYFLQLEHTILYYVVAKMFKALHPELGEQHARNIERDITVSLLTLLQSFWHLSWFHFCITFCLFQYWSFPTPFFSGLLSAFTAVFPLLPSWFSPVSFALVYSLFTAVSDAGVLGVVVDLRVWHCAAATLLSHMDEWLLSVSRGLRGSSVRDAAGVVREELPTFVIGTALFLGYVNYGLRGILFGPITVIVAKVFFDNWGSITVQETIPTPREREKEKEGK
ncbi:Trypanosoma vivax [Trypanosoma theileri]|uniref:Trypanosoma vivax n=1 Tax=Trypanosoma theileri TaxID=67003 RepID=A0A1X0NIH6_9TRYP|nr:Trypanosoma vivax [Trypanosoma theileri]ORC84552.1 Trypanosoma vivax [Trypanosoma theileri]